MNVYKVKTLDEAIALVSKGAKVMAGCTNLYVDYRKNGYPDDDLVDISGLSELKSVKTDGETRLGALVTFADVLRHFDKDTAMYQAAYDMGSPQIRNRATLAGNICDASPACDAGPVLLVLDAKVILRSAEGSREVAVNGFFKSFRKTAVNPGEILTEIVIPDEDGKSVFHKIGLRNALAISVVSLAAKKTETGLRLAMGSVAEAPVRLANCETLVKEAKISADELRASLGADIRPISDIRASGEYRFETAFSLLCDVLRKEYGYDIV